MKEKLKELLKKLVIDRKVFRVFVFAVFLLFGWMAWLAGEVQWGVYLAFYGMLVWAMAEQVIDIANRAYDEAMKGWDNTLNEFGKAATTWEGKLGNLRAEVDAFEAAQRVRKEEIN